MLFLTRESREFRRIKLKAISAVADKGRAQLLDYLHATGLELGLPANFGHYPGLKYEGIASTRRLKAKTDFLDVCL